MSRQHKAAHKAMLAKALAYPGAWEDHPWGETVVKVGKKIFVFLGTGEGAFGCSMKLEHTSEAALTTFPWCAPTGYGLGKAGWVTARFEAGQEVPVAILMEWMEESYRAVAPKRGLPAPGSSLQGKAKAAPVEGKKAIKKASPAVAKKAGAKKAAPAQRKAAVAKKGVKSLG